MEVKDQAGAKTVNIKGLPPRHVHIVGKVLRTRRYEKFTYTTIICPAADEYSKPQVVEIRSNSKFAEKDDKTSIMCTLGGYEGRSYKNTDKETGEVSTLIPVSHFLDFVETV